MLSLIFRVWGKTKVDSQDSTLDSLAAYHPLVCHLIDVSFVAGELWDHYLAPSVRKWIEADLNYDPIRTRAWIRFLAGMHDLGKCTPEFQRKSSAFSKPLTEAGLNLFMDSGVSTPHGLAGAVILKQKLRSRWQMQRPIATIWAQVIGGHHGEFSYLKPGLSPAVYGDQPWCDLREALIDKIAGECELGGVPEAKPEPRAAIFIAGLISVADWLASNQDYFPCIAVLDQAVDPDLLHYRERARKQAQEALDGTGWRDLHVPEDNAPFNLLFPNIQPRPSQTDIDALTQAIQSPAVLVIEAPTGEGKTEAALQVADRLAQAAGQRGFYFALPTQATSNQMFGRVQDFLRHRFEHESELPLYLLHSHAALSDEMLKLLEQGKLIAHLASMGDDSSKDSLFAAEWFTKSKRGLLSPFAVGTIDQSLLATIITRHVFVRLFGLAGKVVIIDEVHAYDTYMSTLLERLLEWLGALSSSAILLSATLPNVRRKRLLEAWVRGAGLPPSTMDDAPYPRMSMATLDGVGRSVKLSVSDRSHRTISLTWSIRTDAIRQILDRVRGGGCAAIVCNTVRSAQETYHELKNRRSAFSESEKPDLFLFHARFPFEDRQRIEDLVLECFGKRQDKRPKRALLVATQVIEQSLDLDFDLLASELAPVDLLLQRAGRLHRHDRPRPKSMTAAELILFKPELGPDGTPAFSRADKFVYNEYVLLQSWRVFKGRNKVETPQDTEALIETVYSSDPAGWGDGILCGRLALAHAELTRAHEDEKNEAENRYIPRPGNPDLPRFTSNPLDEDNPNLSPRLQALTRLSEPSIACVCLFGDADLTYLDAARTKPVDLSKHPDRNLTKRLLIRSLTVTSRKLVPILLSTGSTPRAWKKSAILRNSRPIFLDAEFRTRIGESLVQCDPEFGLRVLTDE